jgi:hypothetical protein
MTDAGYDVFVSYARTDTARARLVRDRLAALGLRVFFDTDGIDTGQEFPDIIDRSVKGAKCVLGLWSRNAFAGRWVRIESRIGLDQNKLVAATLDSLRPEELPAEFYNVNVVSLADFSGQDGHEGWARIVRAIGKRVGRRDLAGAAPPASAPPESAPSTPGKPLNPLYMAIGGLGLMIVAALVLQSNQPSGMPTNRFNASPASAAAAQMIDMSGAWRGTYTEAGRDTAFELQLQNGVGGAFTGTTSDADIYGIGQARNTDFSGDIRGEVLADGAVRFTKTYRGGAGMSLRAVVYEGRISADGRSVAGSWDTGTLHGPFHMERQ